MQTIKVGDQVYSPCPGDPILVANTGNDLFSRIERWGIGEWGHIMLYYDRTDRQKIPQVIESIGRGVETRWLSDYEGCYIKVLRHEDPTAALAAADKAAQIAQNPDAFYDYLSIPRYVLPRILWFKLTGRRYGFSYRHNPYFICSELVDEAYGHIILEDFGEPLPPDFLEVPQFHPACEGILAFEEAT